MTNFPNFRSPPVLPDHARHSMRFCQPRATRRRVPQPAAMQQFFEQLQGDKT